MKIIGICGSPRKGNSEFVLRNVLDKLKDKNIETELFLIREKNIQLCDGCLICSGGKAPCKIKDDMEEIYEKLKQADIIIFVSPVYYDMISPQLLNFIVRLNSLKNELKGKKFAFILLGQLKGDEAKESLGNAADYLKQVSKIKELNLLDYLLIDGVKDVNDAEKKEDIDYKCKNFVDNLINHEIFN